MTDQPIMTTRVPRPPTHLDGLRLGEAVTVNGERYQVVRRTVRPPTDEELMEDFLPDDLVHEYELEPVGVLDRAVKETG